MNREEVFAKVLESLPEDAEITDKRFEAANIVLFSKNKAFVLGCTDTMKEIARKIKKRIEVRSDESLLMKPEEAEVAIKKLVTDEAGINSIDFDKYAGRVHIEADKPGLVIGKAGETLFEIKKETSWTPIVVRTPPMKSDIINVIRATLIQQAKDRAEFLNKVGERIYSAGKEPEWVRLTALGGFREVGRSCLFLQTPESRILMDVGVNVASQENAYPILEAPELDISKLDAVILSHAHMDHCGLIPVLYKYGYKGPVYCNAPTRALMALLQLDFIDIGQSEGRKVPYTSREIREQILRTILLDYEEVVDITPDIKTTFYEAGHIIGSSSVHLHIGDGVHNMVYSADIKYMNSRLLEPAWNQFPRCETLILESTYGAAGDIQPSRAQAEADLIDVIKTVIAREGKVLIPTLGVGRSQELMLILEDLMRNKEMPEVPVYLDGMMWDATAVYTTYPEFLSNRVRKMIYSTDQNPMLAPMFKRVGGRQERENVINGPPCVIMATSGMLTGGPSVEYLRRLCDNERNAIVFINYQGVGSLGNRIQKGWKELPVETEGRKNVIPVKMSVHTVEGFSAHSDRKQLMNYVADMRPRPNLILVNHGEESKCLDLAKSIYRTFRIETIAPKVLDTIRLK